VVAFWFFLDVVGISVQGKTQERTMGIVIPPKSVRNWYLSDVSFSMELIEGFVKNVDQAAEDSIKKYHCEKQLIPDEDARCVTAVHQGLDDNSWDLENLFTELFPSLQRSSALITLYSFFEHELEGLCDLYKAEKGFDIDVSDMRSKGIDRAALYLRKVARLDVHQASQEWIAIKNIQVLRNLVVHRNGQVSESRDKPLVQFVKAVSTLTWKPGGEIVFESGFLLFVVNTFRNYFKLLDNSIKSQMNAIP
jgi:hypothetical protein